jgi:phytoene synthase
MNLSLLSDSYHYCSEISRNSGSNFYRSFSLLTTPRRQAMEALYAFARWTDDLSDQAGTATEKRERLLQWRDFVKQLSSAPAQELHISRHPQLGDSHRLWPALADSLERYRIPTNLLSDLVDGVMLDLDEVFLPNRNALNHYCYSVAGTIGLACLHIWDGPYQTMRAAAIDCGFAFQMTNILRDIREDAFRQRIYIPQESLEKYGCSREQWLLGIPSGNWTELLEDYLQMTEQAYHSGWQLHPHLASDGKKMFSLMWKSYHAILEEIRHQPAVVWKKRISVPMWKKAKLFLTHFGPLAP